MSAAKNTVRIQRMCVAALLCAIAILIPMISPVKIQLGPMSFTLGSHVAIFIAMFISPAVALTVELGAHARVPQGGGEGDGGGELLGHGEDQHVRRGGDQGVVQIALGLQYGEQAGQTDGNTDSGELFIGIIFR